MGAKYTKAQHSATNNYRSDKWQITIVTTADKRQQYKDAAELEGKSLNQFVLDAVDEHLSDGGQIETALQYALDESCEAFKKYNDPVIFHDTLMGKIINYMNEHLGRE